MSFKPGENVVYNSKCCVVHRAPGKKKYGITTTYVLHDCKTNDTYRNIQESDILSANCANVCNNVWNDFVYTGNNLAAAKWVTDNVIREVDNGNAIEYGHNADNSQYHLTMSGTTWTKNRS